MSALSIPADVWALVFGYTFDVETHYNAQFRFRPLHSGLRVICHTLTEGLDEWIRAECDASGLKGGGKLHFPRLSQEDRTLVAQKRTLLALSRAPREVLAFIETIPGEALTRRTNNKSDPPCKGRTSGPCAGITIPVEGSCFASLCFFLAQLTHLRVIEGPFLSVQLVGPGLKQLDFSGTRSLTTICSDFLSDSNVEVLILPESLKVVDHGFLRAATSKKIDLTRSFLERVGNDAFGESKVEELLLPSTFKAAGEGFLRDTTELKVLDLSGTVLEEADDYFLTGSGVERLILPPTFHSARRAFLSRTSAKRIDLRSTFISDVGSEGFAYSAVEELLLPPSLSKVGSFFWSNAMTNSKRTPAAVPPANCADGFTRCVDLSSVPVESVGSYFLERACTEVVRLPDGLRYLNDFFMFNSKVKQISLPNSLTLVGINFLAEATVEQVVLPPTFSTPGDRFLFCATVKVVDLSTTKVMDIGDHFLEGAQGLEILRLPPSLVTIGSRFLFQGSLRSVDLSGTSLRWVGASFLAESAVENLSLPRTLRATGRQFLYKTKSIRSLDLSHTSLVEVESEFLAESAVEGVLVPNAVKANLPPHLRR